MKDEKAPAIRNLLEEAFGRTTALNKQLCTMCGGPAINFRDALSRKEYGLSGMCQRCQDEFFEGGDDDEDLDRV